MSSFSSFWTTKDQRRQSNFQAKTKEMVYHALEVYKQVPDVVSGDIQQKQRADTNLRKGSKLEKGT